jgi:hypothetical protein
MRVFLNRNNFNMRGLQTSSPVLLLLLLLICLSFRIDTELYRSQRPCDVANDHEAAHSSCIKRR